jgi:hypothetical protein
MWRLWRSSMRIGCSMSSNWRCSGNHAKASTGGCESHRPLGSASEVRKRRSRLDTATAIDPTVAPDMWVAAQYPRRCRHNCRAPAPSISRCHCALPPRGRASQRAATHDLARALTSEREPRPASRRPDRERTDWPYPRRWRARTRRHQAPRGAESAIQARARPLPTRRLRLRAGL